jgi:hypothetical protein
MRIVKQQKLIPDKRVIIIFKKNYPVKAKYYYCEILGLLFCIAGQYHAEG